MDAPIVAIGAAMPYKRQSAASPSLDQYHVPDGAATVLLNGNPAASEPHGHLLAQDEVTQPIAGFMGKAFPITSDAVSHQRAGVTHGSAPLAPELQVIDQVSQAPFVEPPIPDLHILPRGFVVSWFEPGGGFLKR